MNKILLIDGHSILNRAFYGLPLLSNSNGQHTNAVLGFLNIIFKIMEEEKPTHMCVAFDVKQPTFRHERFAEYKGTRKPMPDELREQVPLMKEVLTTMGITIVEKGGYEADDIIGTLSRVSEKDGYKVCVVSGDRDLLQLATDNILIRIPKTKMSGTIVEDYYAKDVEEKYQVTPIEFIDLKGLMGDASDNIPGVPGIGEKTATKIITQYKSIENAFAHIDEIKPDKARKNLTEFYDQAILSKELATIKLDCELDVVIEDAKIEDLFNEDAYTMFKQLELKSLLKRFEGNTIAKSAKLEVAYNVVDNLSDVEDIFKQASSSKMCGVYIIELNGDFYGVALSFKEDTVEIIKPEGFVLSDFILDKLNELLQSNTICVFMDLKRGLPYLNIDEETAGIFDIGVGAYLLNPMKDTYTYDDICRDYLSALAESRIELIGKEDINIITINDDNVLKYIAYEAVVPVKAYETVKNNLNDKNMLKLYEDIELPCIYSLYDMEKYGIRVDKDMLKNYGDELKVKIDELEKDIYALSGEEFNINSPKQLGEVLFVKLELPGGKKTKTGYSTNVDVLEKLKNDYPIVEKILEYRQLSKLKSTYADGLAHYISEDNRIHGKFNQTITATGRISSTEPNLQNIPIRVPIGRLIRKVFIPEDGYVFLDADYSQIELRVLAHISGDENLINAYKSNMDIHAITASEVFDIPLENITSTERRNAKAVNFGIVYGISAFSLSNDLNITRKEAAAYIEKYFETYPKVKEFLDNTVAKAKEDGYVTTIYNRIRPIPEIKSSNFVQRGFGERVAMNSPIQGTAADIIKIAMINVNKQLKSKKLKSRLILQVHDELIVETHKDEIDIVKEIMETEMMNASSLSVPLDIEVNMGENWYDAK